MKGLKQGGAKWRSTINLSIRTISSKNLRALAPAVSELLAFKVGRKTHRKSPTDEISPGGTPLSPSPGELKYYKRTFTTGFGSSVAISSRPVNIVVLKV